MKKTILLFLIIFAFVTSGMQAQCYSINKLKYDSRLYSPQFGDVYNPALSGVCSWIIPGLGQMISGETGRGLAFFGGYTACGIVFMTGYVSLIASSFNESFYQSGYGYGYTNTPNSGGGTMLLGLAGMAVVSIWSIVDAVKVAKVNNMYIRDLRKTSSLSLELAPYITQISINNQNTTPVGLSMRVKF